MDQAPIVPDDHLVKQDKFARYIGLELEQVGLGRAEVKMPIRAELCNGLNLVHGGAIFSLADYAFAAACNARGIPTVGLQVNVVYLKAVKGPEEGQGEAGYLRASAQMQAEGRVGPCEVRITNQDNELVALFHGLGYQKLSPRK